MNRIFVSGTGTGIGKTLVCAILAECMEADYWKPVQAGYEEGTDSEWITERITNSETQAHAECYKLKMAASPHIAARQEQVKIDIANICSKIPDNNRKLIIEGPGGLLAPLNDTQFVIDLIKYLRVPVVLVSRNYLGSINHSLLTARVCKQENIPVLGWIFNDHYLDYENEIVNWSGYPKIAAIPFCSDPDSNFVRRQAYEIKQQIATFIC